MPDVNDLVNQLKDDVANKPKNNSSPQCNVVTDENLNEYVLRMTGNLVESSMNTLQELESAVASSADPETTESYASLVNATAKAIDTLSRIQLQREKVKSQEKMKMQDIESRKTLQEDDQRFRLFASREEIMKALMDKLQVIDGKVMDSPTSVPRQELRL